MYQGFYNLASGMLTQGRNLNVISNNMVNVQTPGYKHDTMVSSTFQEEMLYRTGRHNKENPTPLATTSKIKAADQTYVNYDQGSFEMTDGIYDFALGGKGFFRIQAADGERYTRNGNFSVDQEGYLVLNDQGRVLSADGNPIRIDNENFTVDGQGHITAAITTGGSIYEEDGGDGAETETEIRDYGTIGVVDFADYGQLHKEDNGLFSTDQAPIELGTEDNPAPPIQWKYLEKSNVDMVDEMTAMMSSQRALQSAAQVLKMYDQIMSKSVSDVGRL